MPTEYLASAIVTASAEVAGNLGRSILAASGVAVAICTVVVSVGIVRGAVLGWEKFSSESGGINRLSVRFKYDPAKGEISDGLRIQDAETLGRSLSAYVDVAPELRGLTRVRNPETGADTTIDVVGSTHMALHVHQAHLVRGRFLAETDIERGENFIVINEQLIKTLRIKGDPLSHTVIINGNPLTIVGVFGRRDSDSRLPDNPRMAIGFVPISHMRVLLRGREFLTSIELASKRVELTAEVRDMAHRVLHAKRGEIDFEIQTRLEEFREYRRIERRFHYAIVLLAAFVLGSGVCGIFNLMFAKVSERIREIGVRSACGATPAHIFSQFLSEAVLLSVCGALLGIGFGAVLLPVCGYIVPAELPGEPIFVWSAASLSLLVCLACGLIAGIYPALRASRLDPVVALRNE